MCSRTVLTLSHNLCTVDFVFSQSWGSHLCTLRLHSRLCILALAGPSTLYPRVLHSNTFSILALSVLSSLHPDSALSNCAHIVHCAPSRLCALALSALSTVHSRLCTLTLHSRLCTSHCDLIVHSTPSSRLCALALLALSARLSLCTRCTVDSLYSLYSQLCTLASVC